MFLYAAIYDDAEADYEAVFELHAAKAIGTFDSAVIEKDEDGKVQVSKTEKPTFWRFRGVYGRCRSARTASWTADATRSDSSMSKLERSPNADRGDWI